jgi:hypothetical protein
MGTVMPIGRLLENAAFDLDTTALLTSAFDSAWDAVKKSGSPRAANENADSTRDLLAKRIIKMAQQGERDRQRLVDDALAHLTVAR